DVTVTGVNIGQGTGIVFEGEGLTVEGITPDKLDPNAKNPAGKIVAKVRIAPDAIPGRRALRVMTPVGASEIGYFVIGQWPEVAEKEPNNTRTQAQEIAGFPVTITGQCDGEDVDCFRFKAKKGQTLVFDVQAARIGSQLDSVLTLLDAVGHELALSEDANGPD